MGDASTAPQAEDSGRRHYPTYLERHLEGKRPMFSQAYERLIWPIRGDFPSVIQVMPGPRRNIGTPESLFNLETGEWHEIASQSITDPAVSHLEASLTNLECWDRRWERKHMDHADPADAECEFVTYGELNNDVRPFAQDIDREDGTLSWDELEDKEILVHCCGEERPLGGWDVTLEVRPSPENEFVTVKDYVSGEYIPRCYYYPCRVCTVEWTWDLTPTDG
jgi:hypothetical protein